jgi:hypothetical protein
MTNTKVQMGKDLMQIWLQSLLSPLGKGKYYPKIFEISLIISSPFDGGGLRWGWTKPILSET